MSYVINKNDAKKNVLIIDDEPEIIDLIENKLTKYNAKTYRAKDGFDAVFKIENQTFDLIITDLKMPGRDGVFVLEQIRKSKTNKSTPVIVISGYASTEDVSKLVQNKIAGVLIKPIDEEAFSRIMSKHLKENND